MREIKFRAWDGTRMYEVMHIEILKGGEPYASAAGYRDSTAVMQYTGLKDKNGREIYEGDILDIETTEGHEPRPVKYEDGMWFPYPTYWRFYEVIGNIYENPELLESNQ